MKVLWNVMGLVLAFCVGAIVMYFFLWYQVYNSFERAWCQVYTGDVSLEQSVHCNEKKE